MLTLALGFAMRSACVILELGVVCFVVPFALMYCVVCKCSRENGFSVAFFSATSRRLLEG